MPDPENTSGTLSLMPSLPLSMLSRSREWRETIFGNSISSIQLMMLIISGLRRSSILRPRPKDLLPSTSLASMLNR